MDQKDKTVPPELPPRIRDDLEIGVDRPRCPYCRQDVLPAGLPKQACTECMAWHHQACWTEHGACAACGAGRVAVRPAPSRTAGRLILAAMVACVLAGSAGAGVWLWSRRAAEVERIARWTAEAEAQAAARQERWQEVARLAEPRPEPQGEPWRATLQAVLTDLDEAVLYHVERDATRAAPGSRWDYAPNVPRRVLRPDDLERLAGLCDSATLSAPVRMPNLDPNVEEWRGIYDLVLRRGGKRVASVGLVVRDGVLLLHTNRFGVEPGVVLGTEHGAEGVWRERLEELWREGAESP